MAVVETNEGNTVKFTLGSGDTTRWIEAPTLGTSVSIIPAGTAKVQYTLSPPSEVRAATAAAIDWGSGSIVSPAAASAIVDGPVTAIRFVSTSGTAVGLLGRK